MASDRALLGSVASSQNLFVISLTDVSIGIWGDTDQLTMDLAAGRNRITVLVWDTYALAERMGIPSSGGWYDLDPYDPAWHVLSAASFRQETGKAVSALPTAFAVSPFSRFVASENVVSGSAETAVLLSLSRISADADSEDSAPVTEAVAAERVLWQATVLPAMPLVFANTFIGTVSYGPVFLSRISFTVSGSRRLSPVTVSAAWSGGKSLRIPALDPAPLDYVAVNNNNKLTNGTNDDDNTDDEGDGGDGGDGGRYG